MATLGSLVAQRLARMDVQDPVVASLLEIFGLMLDEDSRGVVRRGARPLVARVVGDARRLRRRALEYPGSLITEAPLRFVRQELLALATMYVSYRAAPYTVPDPASPYAADYVQIRDMIRELYGIV